MGQRTGACIVLEKAFAVAFETYFVGDPDFVKPQFLQQQTASIFVAAQSVARLFKPQVCFLCLDAEEQVAQSAAYIGQLHIVIDTPLTERPDDYKALETLHGQRVAKVMNLLSNLAVLQQVINPPATGTDQRAVTDFLLYGLGTFKESNKNEANNLCSLIVCEEVAFTPV
jgi:hypothetical protein